MLKCPYCWIFPHWFVKCLYGIFLLPLFSTSIGIVKDRYLRMAENWRKIYTRKTPNSKNLLSQCFSLCCGVCVLLSYCFQHIFPTQEQRLMSHLLTLLAPGKRMPPPPPHHGAHQPQQRTVEVDGDKPLIEVVDDLQLWRKGRRKLSLVPNLTSKW